MNLKLTTALHILISISSSPLLAADNEETQSSPQIATLRPDSRLKFSGDFETRLRSRYDYSLQGDNQDRDADVRPELELKAKWSPTDTLEAVASVRGRREFDFAHSDGRNRHPYEVDVQNLWILKKGIFNTPVAIQVGRQRLREDREWWWNQNLDAIRMHYFGRKLTGSVGVARPVHQSEDDAQDRLETQGVQYLFADLSLKWAKRQNVRLFALQHRDRSASFQVDQVVTSDRPDDKDAALSWVGVRVNGCVKLPLPKRLCYWGDVAKVSGHETRYDFINIDQASSRVDERTFRDVSGSAYDVGVILEFPFWLRPVFTLSAARGSGDPPQTPGHDGAFRQSGLHRNDLRYRGNSRFRGYGEVLRPDLSNLEIETVGLGVPVNKAVWFEALWHRYQQVQANDRVAGSPLDANPNGNNTKLGDELDLVLSLRPNSGWGFELTAGAFRSGAAYGRRQGHVAGLVELRLNYDF